MRKILLLFITALLVFSCDKEEKPIELSTELSVKFLMITDDQVEQYANKRWKSGFIEPETFKDAFVAYNCSDDQVNVLPKQGTAIFLEEKPRRSEVDVKLMHIIQIQSFENIIFPAKHMIIIFIEDNMISTAYCSDEIVNSRMIMPIPDEKLKEIELLGIKFEPYEPEIFNWYTILFMQLNELFQNLFKKN